MPRRPTPTERDNVAAWLAYNDRVQAQARGLLRVLLAAVIGVLLAVALIHWATPCAEAALCLAPAAAPGRWRAAALATAWRRACRRLHMGLLRTRLQQLLGTAQEIALDPHADAALRLGAVLAQAASVRLQLARLERAHAQDRRLQRLQA